MNSGVLSRSVATVSILSAAILFGSEAERDDADRPIASPPVVAQVPPPMTRLQIGAPGTGAERAAYIIAVGVAVAYVLGKWTDAYIAARKKIRDSDAGTDHQRWVDCEDQRRRDKDAIDRKDKELSNAWVIIGQKDRQIEQMGTQAERHISIIGVLTQTMGQNATTLIQELGKSTPASSDSIPVLKLPLNMTAVPVHEVGEAGDAGGPGPEVKP